MKRALILFLVAVITIVILLLIYNPFLIEKIWLWVVGLIGSIVALIQQGWKWIQQQTQAFKNTKTFNKNNQQPEKSDAVLKTDQDLVPSDKKPAITLLRLVNDGDSTLGILYLNKKFYCYTIEDYCDENNTNCRVPPGIYHIGFYDNPLLNKEYELAINNFKGHLRLVDTPADLITIIHYGGLGKSLTGDIMLTDLTENQDNTSLLKQSEITFGNFYNWVSIRLQNGEKVTLEICNENWFNEKIN